MAAPYLDPRDSKRGWLWALALVAVVLAGPVLMLAMAGLDLLDLDPAGKIVTSLSGSLIAMIGYLRFGTQWVSNAMKRLEQAKSDLDARVAERRKALAGDEARLRGEVDALEKQEEELRQREAEIKETIRTVMAQLQAITPGQILMDFIQDRVRSSDYRKHLGIAALIRRDFDQLGQLIERQNAEFLKQDDGRALKETPQHLINRIVLYIDDLDRCPPDRVVAVLQAVHLLLAFPVFVVVVAVDSRWLSRSLLSQYAELLASRNGMAKGPSDRAAPDDYLEKIFQIPFHVRPLNERSRGRIVRGLLRGAIEDGPVSAGLNTPADPPQKIDMASDEMSHSTDGASHQTQTKTPVQEEAKSITVNLNPDSLRIRKEELEFMETIQPLLGRTPRAVKRFVNVYRLVKSISTTQGEGFNTGQEQLPGYQLSMFLLAVVTGLPTISGHLFHKIAEARSDVGLAREEIDGQTLGRLTRELEAVLPADTSRRELLSLTRWLNEYQNGAWNSAELSLFAPRLDAVARFSFRAEVGLQIE